MESKFEKVLWSVRYVVILAVILSIVASISLIVIGSWDIIQAIIFYNPLFDSAIQDNNQLLFKIISSIDLFLIGIVLLIFGFGIYELFVSEIDFANAKFSESTLKRTIKNIGRSSEDDQFDQINMTRLYIYEASQVVQKKSRDLINSIIDVNNQDDIYSSIIEKLSYSKNPNVFDLKTKIANKIISENKYCF